MKASDVLKNYAKANGHSLSKNFLAAGRSFFLKFYKPGSALLTQVTMYQAHRHAKMRWGAHYELEKFISFIASGKFPDKIENDIASPIRRMELAGSTVLSKCWEGFSSSKQYCPVKSVATHELVLKKYFDFIHFDHNQLTPYTVKAFLTQRRFTPQTAKSYSYSLIKFLKWLIVYAKEHTSIPSPNEKDVLKLAQKISTGGFDSYVDQKKLFKPKRITKLPVSPSAHQLKEIYDSNIRADYKVIFALLAWNGIRTTESIDLFLDDIQWDEDEIEVYDAFRKKKTRLALSPFCKAELKKYIEWRYGGQFAQSQKLFPSVNDRALNVKLIEKFNQVTGGRNQSLKLVRDAFGQKLYDAGLGLEEIQQHMRFKNCAEVFAYAKKSKVQALPKIKQILASPT